MQWLSFLHSQGVHGASAWYQVQDFTVRRQQIAREHGDVRAVNAELRESRKGCGTERVCTSEMGPAYLESMKGRAKGRWHTTHSASLFLASHLSPLATYWKFYIHTVLFLDPVSFPTGSSGSH